MYKQLGALALLTFALGLIFAACGGDDDNGGGLKKVTLMLDWTPNTHHNGIYVAKEKGWYKEAGLDVQIVEPASGGVEQVVASGKADFGVSIQEAVIPARAEGVPIVSIGAIAQHNDSSLMALASDNIKRPKDLEGKTYGGFGGALETALIKKLVSCDGGNPDKVKFVEVGNIDYLVGMEQNRFDFVWVFEGWDVIRARDIENKPITSLKFSDYLNCIPDWYTPLFITSEKMAKDHPDVVRKFMEATSRGYDFSIANPKEAADALLKNAPELDKALVEKSSAYKSTRFVDKGRRWGEQDLAIWEKFESFLRDSGLTTKQVDVKKAFSNDFLPKK
jgi:ABC-type nitrate/sulfonate/bicarbonate transport system substrate-binding protein